MKVEAHVDGGVVEASGTIVLAAKQRTFSIFVEDVELAFSFEGAGEVPTINANLDGPKKLSIRLVDWSNVNGSMNVFEDIATIGEKMVSVGLFVVAVGIASEKAHIVSYSAISRDGPHP